MNEDLMVLISVAILFFGAGGFLFKIFVFNTLKNRQLFKNLNTAGFSRITQGDSLEKLEKYKLSQDGTRSSETIKNVIGAQKGADHNRYLCDVHRITRNRKSSQYKYYTMLVDMLPIEIEGEIGVRTKLAGLAEKLIKMHSSQTNGAGQETTQSLNRDFVANFSIIAKNKYNVRLPENIQKILIQHSDCFPFNQKRGPVTTRLHLSPDGWGIVCNRVTKEKDLNHLLQIADQLTSGLSED